MNTLLRAALFAAAVGMGVPALAGPYEDCCKDCATRRAQAIADCGRLPTNQRASCQIRQEQIAGQCQTGCTKREESRLLFDQRRAEEAATTARLRAQQAQAVAAARAAANAQNTPPPAPVIYNPQ